MILTDATRMPEHETELPRINSSPDSVRRASRFFTDIPARNQVLMFPEIWDLPEGDGHVFCLDDEWRVLAVSVLEPGKCFVPARGSWYPGWTYYFSSGDNLLCRCANIYLLLPALGRAAPPFAAAGVRGDRPRPQGRDGRHDSSDRPARSPFAWPFDPYPIACTVAILLDEPLTLVHDSEYENLHPAFHVTTEGFRDDVRGLVDVRASIPSEGSSRSCSNPNGNPDRRRTMKQIMSSMLTAAATFAVSVSTSSTTPPTIAPCAAKRTWT
jgi:hypothetical protein